MRVKNIIFVMVGCALVISVAAERGTAFEYYGRAFCCDTADYTINSTTPTLSCGTLPGGNWFDSLILQAAASWNAQGTIFYLNNTGNSNVSCVPVNKVCAGQIDGTNNVSMNGAACNWVDNSVLAWASVLSDQNCCITEVDICFNDNITWYTNSGSCLGNCFDLIAVATHEFGHWINGGHEPDDSLLGYKPIMYPFISPCKLRRAITNDDNALVWWVYDSVGVLQKTPRCQSVHAHPPYPATPAHGRCDLKPKIDSVIWLVGKDPQFVHDMIPSGEPLKFIMGLTYAIGDPIIGLSNGFRVYSPDGATWQPIILDTVSLGWLYMFDGGFFINYFSADGSGADTVGVGAFAITSGGIVPPFDSPVWWIETQVSEADAGKHLCIDSSWWPPANDWLWNTVAGPIIPGWGGPYCFEIAAPAPDTVICEPQGGANPTHPVTYWYDVTPGDGTGRCDFHVKVYDSVAANYSNWVEPPNWTHQLHKVGSDWWVSWWNPGCTDAIFSTFRFQFDNPNPSDWNDWTTTISGTSDPFDQLIDSSGNHSGRPEGYGYLVHVPREPCISPGSDLFNTPGPMTFADHFNSAEGGSPLPADFFGPGSDPFDGRIDLSGAPLNATEDLKTTDAIVERLEPACVSNCPSSDTVDVIIRALHLAGTITVTYNGGQSPELWDVDVCLSQVEPQQTGSMTIDRECPEGGTFTSTLPVTSRAIFTRQADLLTLAIDPAGQDVFDASGYWLDTVYENLLSPLAVVKSNGGLVDHDCDGEIDRPYPPTTNFIASARAIPCDCQLAAVTAGKTLTEEEALLAKHGVIPADTAGLEQENAGACCLDDGSCIITTEANCNDVGGNFQGVGTICQGDADGDGLDDACPEQGIQPGSDLFFTPGPMTYADHFNSSEGGIPLPADFFGPGSDPFDGRIDLNGSPLNATEDLKTTDAIVERLQTASVLDCPSSDTIDIEIIALHLTSTSPITVTYNGGQSPELWDVDVCLSQVVTQQTGSMTINRECPEGGTFTSILPVTSRMIFTRHSDLLTLAVDPAGTDVFDASGYWLDEAHENLLSPLGVVKANGGLVDHDCDGDIDRPYPATSNFIASARAIPCDCLSTATRAGKTLTEEEALLASHGVIPTDTTSLVNENAGACCLPDESCIITTELNCIDVGGDFQGVGTICQGDADGDGLDDACPVAPPSDTAIILDTVYNIKPDGTIPAGPDLKFMMRWLYSTGSPVTGFGNGFRVYSPDGATWGTITLDTVSHGWPTRFDLGVWINYFSANGSGADTVWIGGAAITGSGIVPPFNNQVWWIETKVYEADIGRHLCVDSTSISPPTYPWIWATSVTPGGFTPNWSGPHCFEIAACCNHDGIRGDINYDMALNVADLTFMVDYLFRGGPAPPCFQEGDVNGDGAINIADLTYIVDYLFRGGPAPPPCP